MANNKCKSCGGIYEYSPQHNALKCIKCGGIKEIVSSTEIKYHNCIDSKQFDNSWAKDVRHLKCNNCGAEVVLNHLEILSKCSYCGNSSLINVEEIAQVVPDSVIPFKFDKTDALQYFKQGLKKKRFIPNCLKKDLPDINISSSYIGTYIFNGESNIKYDGVLEYYADDKDMKGNTRRVIKTKRVDGKINLNFNDRLYECSSNLTQFDYNYILPYNLKERIPYNVDYLLGYSAEYSDISVGSTEKILEKDLRSEAERSIVKKHHCDRVKTLNLNFEYTKKEYSYCLVPTYIFNYNYKNKTYKTVMNGQTGKLGYDVPRSGVKITAFIMFIILIVCGILGVVLF